MMNPYGFITSNFNVYFDGLFQIHNAHVADTFYQATLAVVGRKFYSPEEQLHVSYSMDSDHWIHAGKKEVKKQPRVSVNIILRRCKGYTEKTLDTLDQHLEFEESASNRGFSYCEHKVLQEPLCAPLHQLSHLKSQKQVEPIFQPSYVFNINKGGTRLELATQLWAHGHGFTDPWFYCKEPGTFTPYHSDSESSINIYGGTGACVWKCISSDDNAEICQFYEGTSRRKNDQNYRTYSIL